jgi:hypothetical protein
MEVCVRAGILGIQPVIGPPTIDSPVRLSLIALSLLCLCGPGSVQAAERTIRLTDATSTGESTVCTCSILLTL